MEAHAAHSPLVAARLRRRLTIEEAAARASLDIDAVKSLEESRTYVFPSTADAIAAAVVYASSLGITEREARELAGLPVESNRRALVAQRWALVLSFTVALTALMIFVLRPPFFPDGPRPPRPRRPRRRPPCCRAAPRALGDQSTSTRDEGRQRRFRHGQRARGARYRIGTVKNADRRTYD